MPPPDYFLDPRSLGIRAQRGPMMPKVMLREGSLDLGEREKPPLSTASDSSVTPLSKDFSFEFTPTYKEENYVFDKIIKPYLRGKDPSTSDFSALDASSTNNSLLSQNTKAKKSRETAGNTVNGLSRWVSVSSISSNDSFFYEGNCHPTIEEEEEDGREDSMSDSGDTEKDSEEMSDFSDDSRTEVGSGGTREATPVVHSFPNNDFEKGACQLDSEETAVEEFEDREKTPACSSHADIVGLFLSVEPIYDIKTHSGKVSAKRNKITNPTHRTQTRAHSAKPYGRPYNLRITPSSK